MKHPTPYNGEPDLKKFNLWTASVVHYVDIMKYRERTMISLISEYVTGRAKEFYIDHVAGRVNEWTFETLF